MGVEVHISPRHLARLLDVPVYLFSDLPFIVGQIEPDGRVVVQDPATPAINGMILMGDLAGASHLADLFVPLRAMDWA